MTPIAFESQVKSLEITEIFQWLIISSVKQRRELCVGSWGSGSRRVAGGRVPGGCAPTARLPPSPMQVIAWPLVSVLI